MKENVCDICGRHVENNFSVSGLCEHCKEEALRDTPPPSQEDRSVSQPGRSEQDLIIEELVHWSKDFITYPDFIDRARKLVNKDSQPSQPGGAVMPLLVELAALRSESQAKDTRIKELEKEVKELNGIVLEECEWLYKNGKINAAHIIEARKQFKITK